MSAATADLPQRVRERLVLDGPTPPAPHTPVEPLEIQAAAVEGARRAGAQPRLFHGGVPSLRPGDTIAPGHTRAHHDGCPWCEARASGDAYLGIDGPAQHPDLVYATPHRLYAAHYASLFGRGDLYRVTPVGQAHRSTEDSIETWCAPQMRVVAVVDRAVALTWPQRRRLLREWGAADQAAALLKRGV